MISFPKIPLILFFFPISKIFHQKFTVSPVLLHLHPKLQIDLTIQHSLNLITGSTSNFFSILPCFPMMIPLCESRSQMIVASICITLFCIFMRSIATAIPCGISSCKTVQCFLTDQFCHNLTFRLICHCVLIIKLRSIWKIFHNDA